MIFNFLLVVRMLLEIVEQLTHDTLYKVLSVDSLRVLIDNINRVRWWQRNSVGDC